MANSPVSLILPQYDIDDAPAAGYYLKGYQAGTTTPITMYTDAAGSSSLAKAALDANGFPVTSGNVKFTPHFAETFDLWLFPDATSADANDTSNATQISDSGVILTDSASLTIRVSTVTALKGLNLPNGFIIKTTEHTTGYGYDGGNTYLIRALTAASDDNGSVIKLNNGTQEAFALFENGPNVKHWGAAGDGATDDVTAFRAAFDYSLAKLQSSSSNGVSLSMPEGKFYVSNELLSDSFQTIWWNQTSLGKGYHITFKGAGTGSSKIVVSSSWNSAVRNSTNGDQRTYGPWANSPSPSCIFPLMANINNAAPAAFNMLDFSIIGNAIIGKDPIPFLRMGMLNSTVENIYVVSSANHGELIMGAFNSVESNCYFESCGVQPIQSGAVMGYAAGFPPAYVRFDISGTTLTAKAGAAFDGYSVGDTVPFFRTSQVGKRFVYFNGGAFGASAQTLAMTISSVSGDGVSTATVTLLGGISIFGGSQSLRAGSFMPVEATTTAASAVVTLSDPILFGDGAADMIGMVVAIPKAGSNAVSTYDVFCSRIVSCDTGNDTDGYTQVTLAETAKNSVTDYFITGCNHICIKDETISATGWWNVNDTDFTNCRWENSGGFNDDLTTSAFQFLHQSPGEAVQYTGCKIHGGNSTQGMFAADGQVIIDDAFGLHMVGCDVTHCCWGPKGSIRLMGARGRMRFTPIDIGSFQLPYDFVALYADPQSGYDADDWSIISTTLIKNDIFPYISGAQLLKGGDSSLTKFDIAQLFTDRVFKGVEEIELDSNDDLDDVITPGDYTWTTSEPSNTPVFGTYATMAVSSSGNNYRQVVRDLNNNWVMERDYFSSAWSPWRNNQLRFVTNSELADAGAVINTDGKVQGTRAINTTDDKMYVARGSSTTSTWVSVDGVDTITPS